MLYILNTINTKNTKNKKREYIFLSLFSCFSIVCGLRADLAKERERETDRPIDAKMTIGTSLSSLQRAGRAPCLASIGGIHRGRRRGHVNR